MLRHPLLAVLPFVALPLAACEQDAAAPEAADFAASRAAERCMNVDAAIDAQLSLWMFNGVLVAGGAPSPVNLGGIDGWIASALTENTTTHGRSQTVHWQLHHVFVTDAPQLADSGLGFPVASIDLGDQPSWFLTDDRAVCAAAKGVGGTCRVNDVLQVVAGAGMFANANGFLHNHGLITITDPNTGAGIGDFHVRGRVCGDGL